MGILDFQNQVECDWIQVCTELGCDLVAIFRRVHAEHDDTDFFGIH